MLPPTEAQVAGWASIRRGDHTLIAAPTGSGKTLAAFLTSIDELLREGLERGELPDEVRVIYVSPLKALSADIHKNLAEPRREIRLLAEEMGYAPVRITAAVRSGDTPQNERAAMLRKPPHILVTTPESLYLLLTAERSRAMLKTARVVILDEIHAVLESRRGAHLALSLERLEHTVRKAAAERGEAAVLEHTASREAGDRTASSFPREAGIQHERELQRIGLSATQKPIGEVARFLVGAREDSKCTIVDRGHKRKIDLEIEVPGSPLEAVMSAEVWKEIYAKLVELIQSHKTTLIMVNTRRLAERMAHQLTDLVGEEHVAAHHGSLSKEKRLNAEERLRNGQLKVLVSTASLELGIDIGHVDLVCQISSPHRIATLLQRVGRSGHSVYGLPKGRVFPLTRDDLIECAAMIRAIRDGDLDRVQVPDKPLDVLAQQIVSEASAEEWDEDALLALFRRAYPYRNLERDEFDDVVHMLSHGYATKRGRRAALITHDPVNEKLRARKGSRMTAIVSGGAIPEVFDYRVLLEPEGTFIGTLNEDFAVESLPGDVFQLGNTSWRIVRIGSGVVRVADAAGQPPSMPFWLGEAPARSAEVSAAVSRLRAGAEPLLPGPDTPREPQELEAAIAWLMKEYNLARSPAEQIAAYLAEGKRALGVIPTASTLVLERFFDESGGMQLVLHAPFGSRVNRAWGLALRKKFCQGFNFELQAAATEEGIILSLGTCHSFALDEVFHYLHPNSLLETLTQAVLASPIFEARWRWTTTLALAVPRNRMGLRVPGPLQRMYAEDLLQSVFPDAVACQDNIQGAREIPDHPLVNQALHDALEEAMDYSGLHAILTRLFAGEIACIARDTPEPSVFCHELLNSAVYTFLDDAPLEERRTQAVYTRRATEPRNADDLGALDADAIQRVRDEAWPVAMTADELHDALMLAGFIREDEAARRSDQAHWPKLMQELVTAGRAVVAAGFWVAIERFQELEALLATGAKPAIPERIRKNWAREDAARELVRGRMEVLGPVTAAQLASSFQRRAGAVRNDDHTVVLAKAGTHEARWIPDSSAGAVRNDEHPALENPGTHDEHSVVLAKAGTHAAQWIPGDSADAVTNDDVSKLVDGALLALETEGRVLRGYFTPLSRNYSHSKEEGSNPDLEWCDRRLLARIHRYTISRLRAEIEAVTAADFMRFLLHWQHVVPEQQLNGVEGVAAAIEQLDGYELAAAAWEHDVLPARVRDYTSGYIDMLCLSGRIAWGRTTPMDGTGKAPLKTSPIALMLREHAGLWRPTSISDEKSGSVPELSSEGRAVYEALKARGASFFHELVTATGLLRTHVERALGELAGVGLVTADSFSGLRALLTPLEKRKSLGGTRAGSRRSAFGVDTAGRWALFNNDGAITGEARTEAIARALLKRYGVVFRALLARESRLPTWRELVMVYRRLEARGEIRGGRFVGGFGGEQFALPDAVGRLRAVRKLDKSGELVVISGAAFQHSGIRSLEFT